MREERRYFSASDIEVRASDDGFVARGHATTFNEPYNMGSFDEQIAPSFFNGLLNDPETMALWNHNDDNVLGNVGSGTLKLSTDSRGLLTETEFPASAVREREAIERGDVRKMSFGFRVAEDGDRWEIQENGRELRTLVQGEKLFDVSPVAFPANPATDLEVAHRSRQAWKEEREDGDAGNAEAKHAARDRALSLVEMS